MFCIDDDDDENDHDNAHGNGNGNGLDVNLCQSDSIMMNDEEAEQYIADYEQRKGKANLNMCSAYTHVFADTIRSISVLVAAILGATVHSITPEIADAVASIVVSAVILFALLPLLVGMGRSYLELMSIKREEASERDMEVCMNYGIDGSGSGSIDSIEIGGAEGLRGGPT